MAKISARGAHKLASIETPYSDSDKFACKSLYALRSDGKILHLTIQDCGSYKRRGNYSIVGRVSVQDFATMRDRFRNLIVMKAKGDPATYKSF